MDLVVRLLRCCWPLESTDVVVGEVPSQSLLGHADTQSSAPLDHPPAPLLCMPSAAASSASASATEPSTGGAEPAATLPPLKQTTPPSLSALKLPPVLTIS